jgi:hypothetical protein
MPSNPHEYWIFSDLPVTWSYAIVPNIPLFKNPKLAENLQRPFVQARRMNLYRPPDKQNIIKGNGLAHYCEVSMRGALFFP